MEEWLSVAQLSKTLGIPETTARRYLNNFVEYFRWEQVGRGKKYHPTSLEILQRIAVLYDTDRETKEIKKILADEYAFVVEDENKKGSTNQPPTYDVPGQLEEFQQKQEAFNKQLIEQLHEQQEYIKKLLKRQETVIEEAKQLSSLADDKREQFEYIMAEYRVRKLLEQEAFKLWNKKPTTERLKKVGLFRKEENEDKRNLFIKDYIDKHFEEYLRKEFKIE
ncbi:MAG TPA: MerR family transcriptional regulator [Pseudogracilibacillus sp.]|nr:MerR family transcriptional regulator [Pseudogracilibacillus sp.]